MTDAFAFVFVLTFDAAHDCASSARMGKIDDMRRQREEQFELQQRRSKTRADAPVAAAAAAAATASAPAAVVVAPTTSSREYKDVELAQPSRPTRAKAATKTTSPKSGGAVAEQGQCPVCKKTKPLANGVLAQHQKGFGKACAGSRRAPA